ncbi:MAG TPA: rod-binding protein [Devosia sp.]|jgi:Rod binding domain-containing protein|nr:rod-binding protein [Devosia sp.]
MQTLAPLPKIDTTSPAYARLHQQAKDLEGVFLTSLMKEMFSSIKTDDQNFGGGFAEETWRGMQAEQFAGAMAEQGGIGLADQLMPTLLRMQEAAPAS